MAKWSGRTPLRRAVAASWPKPPGTPPKIKNSRLWSENSSPKKCFFLRFEHIFKRGEFLGHIFGQPPGTSWHKTNERLDPPKPPFCPTKGCPGPVCPRLPDKWGVPPVAKEKNPKTGFLPDAKGKNPKGWFPLQEVSGSGNSGEIALFFSKKTSRWRGTGKKIDTD